MIGGAARPGTDHDFGRFDDRLFEIRYLAAGDPVLARKISGLLSAADLSNEIDTVRGSDHGVWLPLLLMYPGANVPVAPVSVQPHLGRAHHLKVGHALASGSFTHDLRRFRGQPVDAATPEDVDAFADWFGAALTEGRTADILSYRERAPHAAANHPTDEHLLPVFVALGAAGPDAHTERMHTSSTYGFLRMDAFAFR